MFSMQKIDFADRLKTAAEAKKALLAKHKHRPTVIDPLFAERESLRKAEVERVRQERIAAREAAKLAAIQAQEAELAAQQAQREAELEAIRGERKERKALTKAEQKAKRDARYAARKARQR